MEIDKPLYIYLDQNKWIDVSRAYYDRTDGIQFKPVSQKILNATESNRAIFPLSGYHVAEIQKNSNASRRQRLAKVMALISKGWTISLSENISNIEIQISGANFFGFIPPQLPPIFRQGINFALEIDLPSILAKVIDMPISDDLVREFESFTSTPEIIELILSGNTNSELILIEAKKEYEKGLEKYVETTERFRSKLSSHSQSELEQKKLYINSLQIVLEETINNALGSYNYTLGDVISNGGSKVISFFEGISSLDVEIQLNSRRNANLNKAISKNDLSDISFLRRAIPYCDIVITENSWKDLATRSGLDKKYNTIILSDVKKLEEYL